MSGFSNNELLYPLTKGDLPGHPFHGNQHTVVGASGALVEQHKNPTRRLSELTGADLLWHGDAAISGMAGQVSPKMLQEIANGHGELYDRHMAMARSLESAGKPEIAKLHRDAAEKHMVAESKNNAAADTMKYGRNFENKQTTVEQAKRATGSADRATKNAMKETPAGFEK